jgi:hypothetical protein
VVNGRLEKAGEVDRYRVSARPGEKLLLELQGRELGTSRIEGIITVYDSTGKKLDSAGDKPLPEDVFVIQGTSRTSSDPFLNLTAPAGAGELVVTVEDLAGRGGPLYGYRLIVRREAEDFRLSINTPYVNLMPGGTIALTVTADRLGYDGMIQLTIPNPPKGIHVEGGVIPRENIDGNNQRGFNRTGVLLLTADADAVLPAGQLEIWGEAKFPDGTTSRRRARGPGMVENVAGATAQGVVDRQRPLTAPWLGLDLPAGLTYPAPATLEVRQTSLKQMEEGARYEFSYKWTLRGRATPPADLGVNIVGGRDIRVIDRKPGDDAMSGTFAVTTTKSTDPGRYDLYVSGRIKTDDGDETIVSRPIPLEVSEGTSHVASTQQ